MAKLEPFAIHGRLLVFLCPFTSDSSVTDTVKDGGGHSGSGPIVPAGNPRASTSSHHSLYPPFYVPIYKYCRFPLSPSITQVFIFVLD